MLMSQHPYINVSVSNHNKDDFQTVIILFNEITAFWSNECYLGDASIASVRIINFYLSKLCIFEPFLQKIMYQYIVLRFDCKHTCILHLLGLWRPINNSYWLPNNHKYYHDWKLSISNEKGIIKITYALTCWYYSDCHIYSLAANLQ